MTRALTAVITTTFMSGCVSHYSLSQTEQKFTRWHFGITKVEHKETTDFLKSSDFSALGIWLDKSSKGLGYRHDEIVEASHECKVIFIIKSEAQIENLMKVINREFRDSQGGICTITN